jgi:hypothetical protein
MMIPTLLDVVALLRDIPEENVRRGMVGTIVDTHGDLRAFQKKHGIEIH